MKKILIVDDFSTFIEKERSILNRSDFRIFTATSTEEALNIHKAENMDMIIIDLDMPVMTGDKLCSIIRKNDELKNVSIVMVCNNSESDIKRTRTCKANAYVTKPLNSLQFLKTVSQLLDIPERKSYRVLIKLSIKGESKSESFFCSSKNISSTGILIETDKLLEKGDMISCSFFLPRSEQIVSNAEIVRAVTIASKTFQYGARFKNLDPVSKSAIDAFVNSKFGKK
jgi:CheY-like chemotaxis protein